MTTPREIIADSVFRDKSNAMRRLDGEALKYAFADDVIEALTASGHHILSDADLAARDDAVLERAAAYVEGRGGRIPGAVAFAALVSGNRQPCMSGDARDRLLPHARRDFDDATASLATAIRALKGGKDE